MIKHHTVVASLLCITAGLFFFNTTSALADPMADRLKTRWAS